jgi:hypothetical protein
LHYILSRRWEREIGVVDELKGQNRKHFFVNGCVTGEEGKIIREKSAADERIKLEIYTKIIHRAD